MTINIQKIAGAFAEDKDLAREIRIEKIAPAIKKRQVIVLDFEDVRLTTQSFIHVLLQDVLVKQGIEALDFIEFKNCNKTIQTIIQIVVEYVQASIEINAEAAV